MLKASGDDFDDTLESQRAAAKAGSEVLTLKELAGTNTKPCLPVVWQAVFAVPTPTAGILQPRIFRYLTAFALPGAETDDETNDLCLALSLALRNHEPTEDAILKARRHMTDQ